MCAALWQGVTLPCRCRINPQILLHRVYSMLSIYAEQHFLDGPFVPTA